MYIYLYIDVAMVLLALVELLKITFIIIEKVKDTSSHRHNGLLASFDLNS